MAFDCCWLDTVAVACESGRDEDEEAFGNEADARADGSELRDGDGGFELAAFVVGGDESLASADADPPAVGWGCCCAVTSLIESCAKPMSALSSGDSFGPTPEFYENEDKWKGRLIIFILYFVYYIIYTLCTRILYIQYYVIQPLFKGYNL